MAETTTIAEAARLLGLSHSRVIQLASSQWAYARTKAPTSSSKTRHGTS